MAINGFFTTPPYGQPGGNPAASVWGECERVMIVDIIDSVESLRQVKDNWESVYRADPEAHYYLSWAMIA